MFLLQLGCPPFSTVVLSKQCNEPPLQLHLLLGHPLFEAFFLGKRNGKPPFPLYLLLGHPLLPECCDGALQFVPFACQIAENARMVQSLGLVLPQRIQLPLCSVLRFSE